MSTKRVALVCQNFYPEMASTGMHMTELASRLEKKDWDVRVYCSHPAYTIGEEDDVPAEEEYNGIKIHRVPTLGRGKDGLGSRLLAAVTYLLATVRALVRDRDRYDGLLVTTNPPFLGLAGWYMTVMHDKPYVQLVYDVYPDIAVRLGVIGESSSLAWIWERVSRLMLNRAAATVVIGRDMAELIRQKLRRAHHGTMHFIPNWSDESVVAPKRREQNPFRREQEVGDRFLVQYAGGMGRTHNLEPLIRAASRLKEEPVLFQLIGEGNKKEKLCRMAEERNLENVEFLPFQPREELDTVLAAADLAVVCLESRFTGMSVPSKTYGIMASGTPILGFVDENSEIGRTIRESNCGIVLEDPDAEEAAEAVREGLNDQQELRKKGRRGREVFEDRFTLSHAAERYDTVLQQYFYGNIQKDDRVVGSNHTPV
jgi:glycosyltransferase involved in cell wall biosynthesis